MFKTILQIAFILLIAANATGQSHKAEVLLNEGIELSNEGSYVRAIERFNDALQLDRGLWEAKYELAFAYLQSGNPEMAERLSREIIKSKDSLKLEAMLILGAAYDRQNKSKKSLKVYKTAVHEFPDNYLAYFNLGLSYYNRKEWDKAEESVKKAIQYNNRYPGGHFLMSHIMINKGDAIKAMLSLYYFLLLEQDTERAKNAYEILQDIWKSRFDNSDGNRIISISKGSNNFFKMVDFAVNMKSQKCPPDSNPEESLNVFASNTGLLFEIISNTYEGGLDFWDITYLDFFKNLYDKGYSEPFAYYISNTNYRPQVLVWLSDHYSGFNSFINWMELQE
ncbi:MAG: tetratricopeptide repeat protein [Chlorobi bacterium]|nr:tetratricopeptide repeat protein [Chlorobiota bacterium]